MPGTQRGGYVDPIDLRVEARAQRKSVGRMRHLIRGSLSIVWNASRAALIASIVIQLSGALLLAAQVWAVKLVIDALLNAEAAGLGSAIGPIALLASATALATLIGALQTSVNRYLGERVGQRMLTEVLAAAGDVDLVHFESPAFYDSLKRVQANASSAPFQVTQSLIAIIGSAATTLSVGASLVVIYPPLLLLLVLGGVPLYLLRRVVSRRNFQFAVDQTPNQRLRGYLTYLQADRVAAQEIRAFDLSEPLLRRFAGAYRSYLAALKTHLKAIAGITLLGNIATALVLAAALLAVGWLVATGRTSVAAAGAAVVAIRLLQGQIQTLYAGMQQIFESGLFLDDVHAFMDLAVAARRSTGIRPVPAAFDALAADHVTFRYPNAEQAALDDVSVTIRPGEVIALVGENGSGKTTLAKLLAGLYAPSAGSVTWDGVPLRELNPAELRARIAVIFQDFVRYAFSARDNIAPRGDGTEGGVMHAAEAAGATATIAALPDGLDTTLSRMFRGGVELSGGQWQRIAIARAYYKDAPLVILDEPSAALDPRAEYELFQTLRATLQGRSALFISHRFSTVTAADRILVLDHGRVAEQGTHAELIAAGGQYAELFRLQAEAYTARKDAP